MADRSIGPWLINKRLGQGSFAVVFLATHKDTGQEVAIKSVNKTRLNQKAADNLRAEIHLLTTMRHPNIVSLFDVQMTEHHAYLIMEFCGGGDVSHFIRKRGRLSESLARRLLQQLASGLEYLHAHSLVHRDIKPQNLLLMGNDDTDDEAMRLKIADFGFAKHLRPQDMADTLCGSPLYMAPEILRFHKYNAKADLWSVGAVLFEMVTGRPPYRADNTVQLLHDIEAAPPPFPTTSDGVSASCIDLLRQLLRRDPTHRTTFIDFFKHEWLRSPARAPPPAPLTTLPPPVLVADSVTSLGESDASLAAVADVLVEWPLEEPPVRTRAPTSAGAPLPTPPIADAGPISPDVDSAEVAKAAKSSALAAANASSEWLTKMDSEGKAAATSATAAANAVLKTLTGRPRVQSDGTSRLNPPRTNPFKSSVEGDAGKGSDSIVHEYVVVGGTGSVMEGSVAVREMAIARLGSESASAGWLERGGGVGWAKALSGTSPPTGRSPPATIKQPSPSSASPPFAALSRQKTHEHEKGWARVDLMSRRGFLICEIADNASTEDRISDALALYKKAMAALHTALALSKGLVATHSGDLSSSVIDSVQRLRDRFAHCLHQAQTFKSRLGAEHSVAEPLIYNAAMELAHSNPHKARLLLDILVEDAKTDGDRRILLARIAEIKL